MKKDQYSRKCQHKRELKRRHATLYGNRSINGDKEKCENDYFEDLDDAEESKYIRNHIDHRNSGYRYWETYYLSGRRKVAKEETNRRIRQKYRIDAMNYESRDVPALQNSEYQKEFDYAWEIY